MAAQTSDVLFFKMNTDLQLSRMHDVHLNAAGELDEHSFPRDVHSVAQSVACYVPPGSLQMWHCAARAVT